jgi:hypothetical protein
VRGDGYTQMTRSILRNYRAADENATVAGMGWYDDAYRRCEQLGHQHGHRTEVVVTAMAHLSPRMHWAKSVEALDRLLAGYPKPVAVLSRSWEAGSRCLWVERPLDTFGRRADKTRAFALAILGDTDSVVVDAWAARVAGVDPIDIHSRTGYALVRDAYRRAARRVGIPARELQAVTWCHIRTRST